MDILILGIVYLVLGMLYLQFDIYCLGMFSLVKPPVGPFPAHQVVDGVDRQCEQFDISDCVFFGIWMLFLILGMVYLVFGILYIIFRAATRPLPLP